MPEFHQNLRAALSEQLGQVLTPEVAAHIEVQAMINAMPLPEGGPGLCVDQSPHALAFVNERTDGSFSINQTVTFQRLIGGRLRAVVLFGEWTRSTVEMVVASDGQGAWLSRGLLRAVFSYAFNVLGVACVYGRVRASNRAAVAMDLGLGFQEVGRIPRGFGNEDCLILAMTREQCRWIGE